MEVRHFSDPVAASNLISLYKASRAIPFFGTGFTKDCSAKNGRVPDANTLAKLITSTAANHSGLDDEAKSEIQSISDLKIAFELLSGNEYISNKQRQSLLGNLFSKVKLANFYKESLLKLDWPHIFTFNIDDAIESAVSRYKVILPNRPVSREFISSNNCLFKIHGDIAEYVTYDDPNVVFTWRQYAESLRTNTAMLSYLEEQTKLTAFLFIGCSLDAEVDLLHIDAKSQFSNSIFLKRGKVTVRDKVVLNSYGINQVITFDNYEQIYEWLFESLKSEQCEAPLMNLTFEEKLSDNREGAEIIAHGGPLFFEDSHGNRVARKYSIFPQRDLLSSALEALRANQHLFITGRRFSGKTVFLFQLLNQLTHLTSHFFASSDVFNTNTYRLVNGVENSAFFFDSNYLDVRALEAVLSWKIHHTNKIIFCSSFGDAEIFRFTFQQRGLKAIELPLNNSLTAAESQYFNVELNKYALPNYKLGETLLNLSYRYYEEYKSTLKDSEIFGKEINESTFKILVLISAFGKASFSHVACVMGEYFDSKSFIQNNDCLFEIESGSNMGEVLVCNSSSWLISRIEGFIIKNPGSAIDVVSQIVISLVSKGFESSAFNLIAFDKLNELGGKGKTNNFIRGIYEKIQTAFQSNQHYWLQRAKCELIMGTSIQSIENGMHFATKVRADNKTSKNQTYYSSTLVLAQLCCRMYKFTPDVEILLRMLDLLVESMDNYSNNSRHMDKIVEDYRGKKSDIRFAIDSLNTADSKLLVRTKDIKQLLNFVKVHSS